MEINSSSQIIKLINYRHILNSHLGITTEFVIELANGNIGVGTSPQGETISIYEDKSIRSDAEEIINEIRNDLILDEPITQSDFDRYLKGKFERFGRNNCWALSLALFNAIQFPLTKFYTSHNENGM